MISDADIRALRDDAADDDVVRAVCDYALHGEPIETLDADGDICDMSRDDARRWCAEAIAARNDERPVGIPGALVGRL